MIDRKLLGGSCFIVLLVAMAACQSGSSSQEPAQDAAAPAASAAADDAAAPAEKFFPFKSARIDYQYTGSMEGTETYYVDDWGNTVAIAQDKTEFGNAVKKTVIWKDGQTTIYDHLKRSIWHGVMRSKDTEPPAVARFSEERLASVGYEKQPDRQIAGKTCADYENVDLGVEYCLWKGIDLRIDNSAVDGAAYVREATQVEEGAAIPPSVLAEPEGYRGGQ